MPLLSLAPYPSADYLYPADYWNGIDGVFLKAFLPDTAMHPPPERRDLCQSVDSGRGLPR